MLEKAVRVCDATFGNIFRWDGEAFYLLATKNTPHALAEYRRSASPVVRSAPDTLFGRLAAARKLIHIPDLAADQLYREKKSPAVVAAVELGGVRTILVVPMLKEDELIGCVFLAPPGVQIPSRKSRSNLVKNFAAQAVIAIENARLLNELRQRTTDLTSAQLTSRKRWSSRRPHRKCYKSSAVLRAICSRYLQPCWKMRFASATPGLEIFTDGTVKLYTWLRRIIPRPRSPRHATAHQTPADPRTSFGAHMVATKAVVHVADAAKEPGYAEVARCVSSCRRRAWRGTDCPVCSDVERERTGRRLHLITVKRCGPSPTSRLSW